MRGINKVILVGNLGSAPELKTIADGTAVVKMKLATTETYRLKDGSSASRTQWHTIVAWRSLATLAATYLHKGSLVYLEGKLTYREYTDEGGLKKWVTEIIADQLLMLDKKEKAVKPEDSAGDGEPF